MVNIGYKDDKKTFQYENLTEEDGAGSKGGSPLYSNVQDEKYEYVQGRPCPVGSKLKKFEHVQGLVRSDASCVMGTWDPLPWTERQTRLKNYFRHSVGGNNLGVAATLTSLGKNLRDIKYNSHNFGIVRPVKVATQLFTN